MHSQQHYHPYARPRDRLSNAAIGYLNLVTLLASIPILGAGLWLAHGGSSAATCESALQAPLLAIGFIVLLVSLAGFVGACYHVTWALWLYLLAMLLLVVALLGITVFGLAVTAGGGGRQVPGRPYQEFRITDYSAWLQKRVQVDRYWRPALACVVASRSACPRIAAAAQPHAHTVRMLQATDVVRLQPSRRAHPAAGRGLLPVEQRPRHPLLPV